LRGVSTVAACRDLWNIEGQRPLGAAPDRENEEQAAQRKRAIAAGRGWARAASASTMNGRIAPGSEVDVGTPVGVEL
jgi:hypothetical protein